jgi:hypothetical protein
MNAGTAGRACRLKFQIRDFKLFYARLSVSLRGYFFAVFQNLGLPSKKLNKIKLY